MARVQNSNRKRKLKSDEDTIVCEKIEIIRHRIDQFNNLQKQNEI